MTLAVIPSNEDQHWDVITSFSTATGLTFERQTSYGKVKWKLSCDREFLTARAVLSIDPEMQGKRYKSISDGLKEIHQCLASDYLKS